MFLDQRGKFPTQSQRGNTYIMVMVEIDRNIILVEPLKSRKDPDLARAYTSMMLRPKRAGTLPKKHILDNEVSEAMKRVIKEEYNMEMELVPPVYHFPQKKHSRGGNLKYRGAFPQRVGRNRNRFPAIAVLCGRGSYHKQKL